LRRTSVALGAASAFTIAVAVTAGATTGSGGPALARAAGTGTAARTTQSGPGSPVAVPLSAYVNNDGIGSAPGQANFDGSGYSYPADQMPAAGPVTLGGVPYQFPASAGDDNVVAAGQAIALPQGHYVGAYLLDASSYGPASGTATVHYADGTSTQDSLSAPDWYASGGAVTASYRYTPSATDQHPVSIYASTVWLDPGKTATSITLPQTVAPAPNQPSMHIFALSLQPSVAGYGLRVSGAQSTTKTIPAGSGASGGGQQVQAVDATVQNIGDQWLTPAHPGTATVSADGVRTAVPAQITELAPGEQQQVEIGIQPTRPVPAGTPVAGQVAATTAQAAQATEAFTLDVGIPAYTASNSSLAQHQAPDWFDNAKFGIFIHWGVYSVPAWAPVGKEYAEWYWDHMNDPNDPTYQYHLQHYGETFNYDDFIPQFTAAKFDPKAWVQLFQAAGAKYFVLTSKHHEGFSLFKTAVTHRDAVDMGPHQDLVGELFAADRKYTPAVHPGVYYSLPEWYNPADPWNGHGPQNPYTGQPVPYTGYIPVKNYVSDYQAPQMEELIHQYSPDILWCDIGTPAAEPQVIADYFNHAQATGNQVTVDNRCGLPEYDYTTPEYTKYSATVVQKWEASRGLDPFSYGYNSATPDSDYMTAAEAVQDLVDIVSKNGNLLLDIGPRADGTIPAVMQQRLQQIGAWLKVNGESVYNTTYWWRTPQEQANGEDLRFTVAPNRAFYITDLSQPDGQVVVNSPVPIRSGQRVTLLGYHGAPLHWTQNGQGQLVIDVPAAAQTSGQYAWVFKVGWQS
jgi:alpha-L-fucosidase